jgi:cell division septation protein DedD
MKIAEYISELLIEHDCVIVPDFGGFVCNYAPTGIDPVKHLFEPPAKRILFNKGLTRNDGLLAHHVSGKLKLSYSEALDSIAKEVKIYKEEIAKDKRLTLDNIGLLYIDEKGSLLFQQDTKVNYLADSFGLAAFYHLPAEQGNTNETKVIPIHNERKKVRIYAAAAVIAALAVSTFSFSLLEKQTNLHFSSFDFFPKREAPQYVFSPYKELPKPVVAEPIPAPTPVATAPAVSESVPVNTSSFSVIVGSFSVKENAENLVSQFNKQNIQVSIVGRNPGGLYMVGYGNFPSHDVAAKERDSIRKASIKDAWIKAN